MNLLSNTTTKELFEVEDLVENEQFVQISEYRRTHKDGGGIKCIDEKGYNYITEVIGMMLEDSTHHYDVTEKEAKEYFTRCSSSSLP